MQALRPSYYNLSFEWGNGRILFNTASGAVLLIPTEHVGELSQMLDSSTRLAADYRPQLRQNGLLVDETYDELAAIKARFWRTKHIDPVLRMMLCTTFACNFHCDYCFEGRCSDAGKMTPEVEEGILRLVEARLPEIKTLRIYWFGGEPLLHKSPIGSLGPRLKQSALQSDVEWDGWIVSNGFLLDRSTAEWLLAEGITRAQVTFDGCAKDHDGRRYRKRGEPTFQTILNNIVSWQHLIQPYIRVNVDRRNIDGMPRFVDELVAGGIDDGSRLHFGMARNFNNDTLRTLELPAKEFRARIHPVYWHALSKGMNIDYGTSLHPKDTVCDATRRNTVHVGPDGTIWKCFPSIGTSRGHCGNVCDGGEKLTDDAILYEAFDPFADGKCRQCKLLPMCMRRCPYEDISLKANTSVCDFYDMEELGDRLRLVVATGNKNSNVTIMEPLA